MIKIFVSTGIYFLFWLGCFGVKDLIFAHDDRALQRASFCFFAALVFAYINGFEILKIRGKCDKKIEQV